MCCVPSASDTWAGCVWASNDQSASLAHGMARMALAAAAGVKFRFSFRDSTWGFKKGGLPSPCLLTTKPKRVSCSLRRVFTVFTRFCRRIKYIDQLLFCIESCCTAPPCTGNELTSWRFCQATARQKKHATSARRLIHTI